MSNSKNIQNKKPESFLNLPDAPDFISKPPKISIIENIKQCEEMLPIWNKNRSKELEKEKDINWEPFYL